MNGKNTMSAESLLPDSCAWIDYFNGRSTPLADLLAQALTNREIVTCGVVMYELFQGVKTDTERETLRAAFSSMRYLEMESGLWVTAAQLSASLRSKGVTIPFSDIIIATLARRHNLVVLTVDKHFSQVPELQVENPV